MSEHLTQASFIQWCQINERKYPELKLSFAIPNGAILGGDLRLRAIQMGKLKKEGLRPGVPDWCLPLPRGGYNGLFIEFKFGRNKLSDEQKEFIALLELYRHCVQVCYTVDEAIKTVIEYLEQKIERSRPY